MRNMCYIENEGPAQEACSPWCAPAMVRANQKVMVIPGRARVSCRSGICKGGALLANDYLEAGVGVCAGNYASLRALARRLKQRREPCVVGGDFNLTENVIQQGGGAPAVRRRGGEACPGRARGVGEGHRLPLGAEGAGG